MKIGIVLILAAVAAGVGWGIWRGRQWDGRTQFTVISISSPVTVASFDPVTGTGIRLVLPDNLKIDAVGGKGTWQAGILEKAGRQWGDKWAADSLADYLGISYVGRTENLELWDRIMWWWWSRQVKWQEVDLVNTVYLTSVRDPDGVEFERLGPTWPEKAQDWFTSASLAKETVNVSIINSTDVPGLGAHAATVAENAGVRVVAVNNTAVEVGKCVLAGNADMEAGLTGSWLTRVFGCRWQVNSDPNPEISLTVGSEYKKWWTGN